VLAEEETSYELGRDKCVAKLAKLAKKILPITEAADNL
jgi:hypothetical protein